jgi:NADPH:quinone reductase-like Zn-dependent oxidoreductase
MGLSELPVSERMMPATAPGHGTTMKAIVRRKYGSPDLLSLEDVEIPAVEDDRVLVRVHAASVNALDWHVLRGLPYLVRMSEGLRKPKRSTMGVDLAGSVEAIGKNVTQFQPGDEVFGARDGAFAEYVAAKENKLVRKPANVTFEQAAAVPVAGCTALQALRDKGQVQPGQRVLINGAAGGVGTFCVQLAKAFGADVTATTSTRNVDLVRSIGADRVIDYTQVDFTRTGERFDLILDIGGKQSLFACRRALTRVGTYVIVGGPSGRWIRPMDRALGAAILSRLVRQRLLFFIAKLPKEDLILLKELMEAGKVTPVIDRTYPLRETPEAIRYLEEGHARGKVVITV